MSTHRQNRQLASLHSRKRNEDSTLDQLLAENDPGEESLLLLLGKKKGPRREKIEEDIEGSSSGTEQHKDKQKNHKYTHKHKTLERDSNKQDELSELGLGGELSEKEKKALLDNSSEEDDEDKLSKRSRKEKNGTNKLFLVPRPLVP